MGFNDPPPFYRGHEGFKEVLVDKRLGVPGCVIRVYNYARFSGNEELYVIGTDKQLFDAQTLEAVKPEDVFSKEAAPDGWSVENYALHLLPDEEIKKILEEKNNSFNCS